MKPGPERQQAYQQIQDALEWAMFFLEPLTTRCHVCAQLMPVLRANYEMKIDLDEASPLGMVLNVSPMDDELQHA